jgi:hypothetical protein
MIDALVLIAAGFVLGFGVGLGSGLWTCDKKADD